MYAVNSHISNRSAGVRPYYALLDDLDQAEVLASDARASRKGSRSILRAMAHCQQGWQMRCRSFVTTTTGMTGLEALAGVLIAALVVAFISHELGWLAHQLLGGVTGHGASAGTATPALARRLRRSASGGHRACRRTSGISCSHAHVVSHGTHATSGLSSWPGASEISHFVSAHGSGLLVPVVLGALGIWLAMTVVRVCCGYYLRTDRAGLSVLDNSLTLVVFGVGVIVLAAVLAPSGGFGISLLHDLGSFVGANSGSVGGGV